MPGNEVKNWSQYEALRRKGMSKTRAAKITNAVSKGANVNAFGIDHGPISKSLPETLGRVGMRTAKKRKGVFTVTDAERMPPGRKPRNPGPFADPWTSTKYARESSEYPSNPRRRRAVRNASVAGGATAATGGAVELHRRKVAKGAFSEVVTGAKDVAGGFKHGVGGGSAGFGGKGARALNAGAKIGGGTRKAGQFTAVNKVPLAVGAGVGAAVGGTAKLATGQPDRQGPGW